LLNIKTKIEAALLRKMAAVASALRKNEMVLQYMDLLINKGEAGEKEWWIIGSVYAKEDKWDKAAKAFLRALEINRNNFLYIYWLGKAKEKLGDELSAETLYDEVLKRCGEFWEALFAKGQLRQKKEDPQEALAYFEKCKKLRPNDAETLNNIALCCLKTGETEKALCHLKEAISIKPHDITLLSNYGMTCIKLSRYLEAVQVLETVLDRYYEVRILESVGYCYGMLENYEKSIEYYKLALEIEPENQEVRLNLASIYAKSGDNKKALEIFKKLVSQNPKDYLLLNNLAWVYENMKEYKAAESQYYRGLVISMGDPEIAFNLSCCLKKQHNFIEALEIINHLKETSGWYEVYCASLAETYEYLGADRLAVEYYNKAYGLERC